MRDKSLVLAVEWLKLQGADTIAELCEHVSGACNELVDRLGLPPIKAKRLREALEGTARTVSRARASGASRWWFSRKRRGMCNTGEAAKHAQAAKEVRYGPRAPCRRLGRFDGACVMGMWMHVPLCTHACMHDCIRVEIWICTAHGRVR